MAVVFDPDEFVGWDGALAADLGGQKFRAIRDAGARIVPEFRGDDAGTAVSKGYDFESANGGLVPEADEVVPFDDERLAGG